MTKKKKKKNRILPNEKRCLQTCYVTAIFIWRFRTRYITYLTMCMKKKEEKVKRRRRVHKTIV